MEHLWAVGFAVVVGLPMVFLLTALGILARGGNWRDVWSFWFEDR